MSDTGKSIIVFDGVCNFCNWGVNFVIRQDKNKVFFFVSSQSESGRALLKNAKADDVARESIVLLKNGEHMIKSDAVLEIVKDLTGPWKYMGFARIIPKILRDGIYSILAKYRYRLFGKRDSCMIPPSDVKDRFLE